MEYWLETNVLQREISKFVEMAFATQPITGEIILTYHTTSGSNQGSKMKAL